MGSDAFAPQVREAPKNTTPNRSPERARRSKSAKSANFRSGMPSFAGKLPLTRKERENSVSKVLMCASREDRVNEIL